MKLLAEWRAGLVLALLALAACGGGVGTEGTGASTVPTLAAGPIEGFGSIVVAGVRYDNDSAAVDDLAGSGRGNADLRLGMVVEVEAGAIDTTSTPPRATAQRIRVVNALLGPLDEVATGRLVVLGQPVLLSATTVVDASQPLEVGQVVEVFGDWDPGSAGWRATRVQALANPPARWQLQGPVGGLDVAAARFSVGAQGFSFAGLSPPAGLADQGFVRLQLLPAQDATGRWQVATFGSSPARAGSAEQAEIEGRVTRWDAATPARLDVNGQPVDASAVVLPAGLALGSRVEVQGRLVAGTLVASRVELEDDDNGGGGEGGFEFEGTVNTVDSAAQTFTLRRRPDAIYFGRSDLQLENGSLALLVPGAKVHGRGRLSADRSRIEATVLKFEI